MSVKWPWFCDRPVIVIHTHLCQYIMSYLYFAAVALCMALHLLGILDRVAGVACVNQAVAGLAGA